MTIDDILRNGILAKTKADCVFWTKTDIGHYKAKYKTILVNLIDNRGTCAQCGEELQNCECDVDTTEGTVYLSVELDVEVSSILSGTAGYYGDEQPSLLELADEVQARARPSAVDFYDIRKIPLIERFI